MFGIGPGDSQGRKKIDLKKLRYRLVIKVLFCQLAAEANAGIGTDEIETPRHVIDIVDKLCRGGGIGQVALQGPGATT